MSPHFIIPAHTKLGAGTFIVTATHINFDVRAEVVKEVSKQGQIFIRQAHETPRCILSGQTKVVESIEWIAVRRRKSRWPGTCDSCPRHVATSQQSEGSTLKSQAIIQLILMRNISIISINFSKRNHAINISQVRNYYYHY